MDVATDAKLRFPTEQERKCLAGQGGMTVCLVGGVCVSCRSGTQTYKDAGAIVLHVKRFVSEGGAVDGLSAVTMATVDVCAVNTRHPNTGKREVG